MSENNPENKRELLEQVVKGDFSDPEVQLYLLRAAKEILENLDTGKLPNADKALRLKGKDKVAASMREYEMAMEVERLYRAYGNQDAAIHEVAKNRYLSTGRVERIYRKDTDLVRFSQDRVEIYALIYSIVLAHEGLEIARKADIKKAMMDLESLFVYRFIDEDRIKKRIDVAKTLENFGIPHSRAKILADWVRKID